ncbi:hypothetical protein AOQ84DRAFT_398915 [Glonium stellatum]|uniref:MFS general substrate transporter n=1 Tax=Glonium stellatum TaxID=574774 RepID=A0A8E2EXT7_9PEZI|nr:hypothetical protein AOQ84DRAFT_398915 [Glonium stellatum]
MSLPESQPLLSTNESITDPDRQRVLPIALAAAFAMAATSATTVFAYASLLCEDPAHCKEHEQKNYSGTVAIATTIANICGVFAVGVFQQLIEARPKIGLTLWLIFRASSVAVLAIGVLLNNITIAISGRFFEGLATDNLLHYNLSTIYIRSKDQKRFSKLMGTSLALYMVGMSLSPTIMALLPRFFTSFIIALGIFGCSLVYLEVVVPIIPSTSEAGVDGSTGIQISPSEDSGKTGSLRSITKYFRSITIPLRTFAADPALILPSLALFFYNMVQAYLFPAIMVHASLKFGFTGRENGYLISMAAATSSMYLFFTYFAIPRIKIFSPTQDQGYTQHTEDLSDASWGEHSNSNPYVNSDFFYALVTMSAQLVFVPCIILVVASWQLYLLVVLVAFGLATPSFIKSYAITLANDKDTAISCFAVTESVSGLLSAAVLGSVQSLLGEGSVFITGGCSVGVAMLMLVCSSSVRLREVG